MNDGQITTVGVNMIQKCFLILHLIEYLIRLSTYQSILDQITFFRHFQEVNVKIFDNTGQQQTEMQLDNLTLISKMLFYYIMILRCLYF